MMRTHPHTLALFSATVLPQNVGPLFSKTKQVPHGAQLLCLPHSDTKNHAGEVWMEKMRVVSREGPDTFSHARGNGRSDLRRCQPRLGGASPSAADHLGTTAAVCTTCTGSSTPLLWQDAEELGSRQRPHCGDPPAPAHPHV